jgi:hypothetical protein
MDDGMNEEELRIHRKHCLYGCSDCRRLLSAEEARAILNPGQTNQTRVPIPGPISTPPAQEPQVYNPLDIPPTTPMTEEES